MKKYILLLCCIILSLIFSINNSSAAIRPREEYEKTGHVIWEVNTDKRLVAITFDDGPHPIFTAQILDLLSKYNAKATFFVSGNKAKAYPELIKRQIQEGHEVGNHTYHHFSTRIRSAQLSLELDKTNKVFEELTGRKMSLYRPVEGVYNDEIINTAIKNGYDIIMWSWHQDPRDWSNPGTARIVNHITKRVTPGDIILLHDWGNLSESQTVQALEPILKYLKENNYRSVTISELIYHSVGSLPEPINPVP